MFRRDVIAVSVPVPLKHLTGISGVLVVTSVKFKIISSSVQIGTWKSNSHVGVGSLPSMTRVQIIDRNEMPCGASIEQLGFCPKGWRTSVQYLQIDMMMLP